MVIRCDQMFASRRSRRSPCGISCDWTITLAIPGFPGGNNVLLCEFQGILPLMIKSSKIKNYKPPKNLPDRFSRRDILVSKKELSRRSARDKR